MRIIHKGLVMVAVPLAFELTFAGCLIQTQSEMERLTAEESRSKEIMMNLNDLYTSSAELVVTSYARDISVSGSVEAVEQEIEVDCANLERLLAGDQMQLRRFRALRSKLMRFQKYLRSMQQVTEGGQTSLNLGTLKDLMVIQKTTIALKGAMRAMSNEEKARTNVVTARLVALKRDLSKLILFGILANVAVAAAMASYFASSITRHVDLLVTNSRRLAGNKELLPPMDGTDELKALDSSFHEASKALREAEELKRKFYHMVAHDLRSPLAAVSGLVQMIRAGVYGDVNSRLDDGLNVCDRNLSKVLRLVNDILELDKLRAGKMPLQIDAVPAAGLIADLVQSVKPLADAKRISLVEEAEKFTLRCDEQRLAQALLNLCANAIKFSSSQSQITVGCSSTATAALFFVKDEGRGIPADSLAKLFDEFEQVETSDGAYGVGTGLGLSICKMIAEAHDGKIYVQSEIGVGSTFFIELPLKITGNPTDGEERAVTAV